MLDFAGYCFDLPGLWVDVLLLGENNMETRHFERTLDSEKVK